jgi:hypothetical protein
MVNRSGSEPLIEDAVEADAGPSRRERARLRARHALAASRSDLKKSTLKLAGYLVGAYLVLRLIPSLRQALGNLERLYWPWIVGALALETLSETGFVLSWRAIVDPDNLLCREGGGRRIDMRAAWAQLGGGSGASAWEPGSCTGLECRRS